MFGLQFLRETQATLHAHSRSASYFSFAINTSDYKQNVCFYHEIEHKTADKTKYGATFPDENEGRKQKIYFVSYLRYNNKKQSKMHIPQNALISKTSTHYGQLAKVPSKIHVYQGWLPSRGLTTIFSQFNPSLKRVTTDTCMME